MTRIDVIDKMEKGLYYIDICNQYEDFININVIINDAINAYIKTDMFYFNFKKVCSTISFNNKRECNFVINILKSMKNVEMVQENINKMLKQLYGL